MLANSSWRVKDTTSVGKRVKSWQLTFANRSHVKYEFTSLPTRKKLARIETSSICRQQLANIFANCSSCEGCFYRLLPSGTVHGAIV